ncbi:Cytochrome C [Labilithrix luteola]|uniref:Cytochrome C n=1 Tax=Labilithrix luteola TaxID=1391654 RepID=A0A0K1PYE1_9BACT|nr:cytochrome c [Labilithrix luteola]AKU98543.1 Cytochrome C [Labilithrix luteola]
MKAHQANAREEGGATGGAAQIRRENPEPVESRGPLPALFLVLFGVFGASGFTYLVQHGGDDFSFAGDERSPQTVAASTEVNGQAVFQASCAPCHQASGLGIPKTFPPLVGSTWLLEDKETPIRIVLLGLQGPIEVNGERYQNTMPALRTLRDAEIAAVLTHERSSWGNQAPEITEEDVRAVRESLAGRTEPWNGGDELLLARRKAP